MLVATPADASKIGKLTTLNNAGTGCAFVVISIPTREPTYSMHDLQSVDRQRLTQSGGHDRNEGGENSDELHVVQKGKSLRYTARSVRIECERFSSGKSVG